jgi:hypothetical protein
MLELGQIAFAQPWLLTVLAGLPVLWWLLRVTPPAPRRIRFPAIRLLLGLAPPEQTPARTPWWLLALRLAAAGLMIAALAQPLLNPSARLTGSGPLVLVIDDGWAAARNWDARRETLDDLLAQAERQARPVVVLTTTRQPLDQPVAASGLLTPQEARRHIQSIEPKPWFADREAALAAAQAFDLDGSAHVIWLSDGIDDGRVDTLAAHLQGLGRLDLLRDTDQDLPRLILPPDSQAASLVLGVRRAAAGQPDSAVVIASGDDGRFIARAPISFAEGEREASATLDVPIELRNRIAQLHIEGELQAGAVLLLDERWRRRPVGLVEAASAEHAQPLLSQLYYLERALSPYTELRRGSTEELLERELAIVAVVDMGPLEDAAQERLSAWVERGGLLVRFAGPRLAAASDDPLLPVALRGGDRIMGGIMTWARPASLAPFDPKGPFAGLTPSREVLIERQVLAEPSLDLGEKTWARLADGTPLVTAAKRGEGWIVLVHTTANNEWSNFALSGLFVDMLRRIVAISQGITPEQTAAEPLPPLAALDGFGRLGPPPATALAANPPGFYGREGEQRAHNLVASDPSLRPIKDLPPGVRLGFYSGSGETDLKPWILAAALALLLLDLVLALTLRGLLRNDMTRGGSLRRAGTAVAGIAVLLSILLLAGHAAAQEPAAAGPVGGDDEFALDATLETRLAYVETGDPEVDAISRAGLDGLSRVLTRRTSVEPGTPMGVDPGHDEIGFFSLLYWPVVPEQAPLDEAARRRVNDYLAHGGTILFDLRESAPGAHILGRASRGSEALMRLTQGLNVPPLAPVPPDHVLTKSFYLMQDFPGRYAGGTLWVGATEGHVNDGVTSVLVGSNDWASAWALEAGGRAMFAVVPGGERQREMSYRVGVNLVMYALTGNYKADQVHVPFILERLGQ